MPGTSSQVYIQIVFAVKGRQNLIAKEWKAKLNKCIAGIISGKQQKPIIVNGMPDHIHILIGLRPSMSIADITRKIKNNSSRFISQSQIGQVYNYILNQEEHHKRRTFQREYIELLDKFEIPYNEKYVFD